MSDSSIRVTDKRLFTADGELREEYRFLDQVTASEPAPKEVREVVPEPTRPAAPAMPPTAPGEGPSFVDLLAMIAEPAALYLGDLRLPNGQSAEDLELARLHIDLLALLRDKTAGNLAADEAAMLEDTLYRLQMRYVEKRP